MYEYGAFHVLLSCLQAAAEITRLALEAVDPVAQEAVDMLMNIVGAEAGAMALRCMSAGETLAAIIIVIIMFITSFVL